MRFSTAVISIQSFSVTVAMAEYFAIDVLLFRTWKLSPAKEER